MDLKKQIYNLLELEEKKRFINQSEQERFGLQGRHFINHVVSPVFNEIKEEFSRYGRSVEIGMAGFSREYLLVYPKLSIAIPDGRTFNYWVKLKRMGDKFCIERFRSIKGEGGKLAVYKLSLPHGRQLLGDLSDINEEYIQRDIIELYQRHIMLNKKTVPHAKQ